MASLGSSFRLVGAQPLLQAHVKVPGLFVHKASGPQMVKLEHSSMSKEDKVWVIKTFALRALTASICSRIAQTLADRDHIHGNVVSLITGALEAPNVVQAVSVITTDISKTFVVICRE